LAVDSLVDFSKYDSDGDRYVDALFIVHAGPGAEYTGSDDDIWSHAWVTSSPIALENNNVYVWKYTMEPEYWDTTGDMTIGVYAHELGHALFGLPDLYDRDDPDSSDASSGLDLWSLMAAGSWLGPVDLRTGYMLGGSPAFPDAWCHCQMGYVKPTIVTANTIGQVIADVEFSPAAYRLWTGGSLGNEYFLVENRQQVGYDYYLPGSGLLIYHVDEQQLLPYNDPPLNDNEWYPGHTSYGHYLVALEQADGLYDLEQNEWADAGDPYPGITGNTTFDFISKPSSQDYDATDTYVAVRNISSSGLSMTADFFVLPVEVAPPQLVAINDVPEDQGGWVTASWAASEDDSDDSPNPVLFYSIWLKDTDGGGDAAAPLTVRLPEGSVPESVTLAADGWIGVGSLGAIQDSSYRFLVHTLQDSNQTGINWTYVRISAHAADPYVYSFSAVDSGYSVDNIVPGVPADLAAATVETGIRLSWYYDLEAVEDFQYFAIYRSEEAAFEPVHPDSATYLTEDTVFVDEKVDYGVSYYYRVAATDYNGNYSDLTDAVFSTGLPEAFALKQNYPNPFNLSTTLRFDLPRLTRVSIIVYDLRGREVVRLFDGLHPSGCDQVEWDGQSADGRELPSGVYFARMVIPPSEGGTPGFTHSIKMLLLK